MDFLVKLSALWLPPEKGRLSPFGGSQVFGIKNKKKKSSNSHLLKINQSIFDKYHIVNTFTLYIYLIL